MLPLLLLIIVIAVLMIRGQSKRQHREMLSAINPEKLRQLDQNKREADRRGWIAMAGCGIAILFAITFCQPQPKKPTVTYHEFSGPLSP